MYFLRENEMLTIKKKIAYAEGLTLSEGDYSIKTNVKGLERYASPPVALFIIVQPSLVDGVGVAGSVTFSIRIDNSWNDGLTKLTIQQTVLTTAMTWWTKNIGTAAVIIQKTVKEINL